MNPTIPKWIIIYAWFITIMTIVFTVIGFLMPDIHSISPNYTGEIDGPLRLYLSRNIAIVVLYLFALFYERFIVFKAVFILRAAIDFIDFFQEIVHGNLIGMVIPLILLIINILVIIKLYRLKK